MSMIESGELLEREINYTQKISKIVGIACPEDIKIKQAMQTAEATWGISAHHRFVVGGMTAEQLFVACESAKLKIDKSDPAGDAAYFDAIRELVIPTDVGVINQDLSRMMTLMDFDGRPFNQIRSEQIEWTQSMGGDGQTTVAITLFLVLRKALEFHMPPWTLGWCRCREFEGLYSLDVAYSTAGLRCRHGEYNHRDCSIGTIAQKFIKC